MDESLEKVLTEIEGRAGLVYFFQELVNPESAIPRVFLLHRQDLFPGFEQMDIMFPLLFVVNRKFERTEIETTDSITLVKRLNEIETTTSWNNISSLFSWAQKQFSARAENRKQGKCP